MVGFTQIDFPHIRSKLVCPCCHRPKDNGAITCWPCYRAFEGRNGYQPHIHNRLEGLETFLAACDDASVRSRRLK